MIAPIGDEGSDTRLRSQTVLDHVITPVVRECGYADPVRADQIAQPGIITTQVVQHLLDDDLVVADLTGHNANVFYELAVRHAVQKPVVQLIEQGERIPFDVAASRTVQINHHDLNSVARGKAELAAHIQASERDPMLADNPITMAVDLRVLRSSKDPVEKRIAEALELLQEVRTGVKQLAQAESARASRERISRMVRSAATAKPPQPVNALTLIEQVLKERARETSLEEVRKLVDEIAGEKNRLGGEGKK